MPGSRFVMLAAASLLAICGLAACGDESEPEPERPRSYALEVTRASFPARQHVAAPAELALTLRNPGRRTVPAIEITVTPDGVPDGVAFGTDAGRPDAAVASRPVWIVGSSPGAGPGANRSTWPIGSLGPDETQTVRWKLTPVRTGRQRVRWTVGGGGTATTIATADGEPLSGVLRVTIDRTARQAGIDPETGKVVYGRR